MQHHTIHVSLLSSVFFECYIKNKQQLLYYVFMNIVQAIFKAGGVRARRRTV